MLIATVPTFRKGFHWGQNTMVVLVLGLVLMVSCIMCESLNTPVNVLAGQGTSTFTFDLGNNQNAVVDIVSPNVDFSFTLGFSGNTADNSDKMALKDTPVNFFTFQVNDEASKPTLTFGAALRFIYNDALFNVDPATLSMYQFRSDKWREFPDVSTVTVLTKTITQSFQRQFLRPGVNQIGVFGGNSVTFPADDYDYDMFTRYSVPLQIQKTIKNTFAFALPNKGDSFELDILGSNTDYSITVERHSSNPNPGINFPTGTNQGIFYFTITNANNAKPTYNAVFRYKFKTLPNSIPLDSVSMYYVSGGAYTTFTADVNRDNEVVTQGASSIDDQLSVVTQLVIVGEGSSPNPSPSPFPSNSTSPSPSVSTPAESSNPSPSGSSTLPARSSGTFEPQESSKQNSGSPFQVNLFIVVATIAIIAVVNRLWV